MGLINYIDIDWPDLFKPILTSKTNIFNRIRVNREIIPIIFVPGIMGSRLRNTKTKESVWDPDRSIMIMLRKYGGFWNTPAQRKRMLIGDRFDPEHLEVSEKDTFHNLKINTVLDPGRSDRGWGGVFWDSYGEFLQYLQKHKWDMSLKSDEDGIKKELIGKCFEFPVHAFGYNWTDSNENSGIKLANKIDEIITGYKSKGRLCKHVILVSHSMGGLVCRAACSDEIGKAEKKVLGVIHGVQPATGAAAAYWRMKAGWERTGGIKSKASAWVLGTNGEEVTCILGNAPGGLELLPNKHYKNNKGESGWLRVPVKGGGKFALPRNGNPYEEIYKLESSLNGNVFWRLINPDWLEPRDKQSKAENAYKTAKKPWKKYTDCIDMAEIFHDNLKTDCHKYTYQFYSSNRNTVDKIKFSREKLSFITKQHEIPTEYGDSMIFETTEPSRLSSARGTSIMYVDNNEQEIKSPQTEPYTTHVLTMAHVKDFKGGGDGTVPDSSGNALKEVLHSYKLDAVEHQEAYGDVNAMVYVFSAIRNLALKRIKEGEVASAK